MEGCDDQFAPFDAGEPRRGHLDLNLQGLWQALVVEISAHGQRGGCDQRRAAVSHPPGTRALQPCRGTPGEFAYC